MRIVFMGTPDFAVPSLEKLIELHDVCAVFTQPDKPKGRGQKVQFTSVKEIAVRNSIPSYQPVKLRNDNESLEVLKRLNPDIIVVIAYGQILPTEILNIPKYGCINVHASLLPDLRGAAPINWSIIRGYDKTGVTTMLMNAGLDTGDILLSEETNIGEDENAQELHDRLALMGINVLARTIKEIENGSIIPQKQDDSKSSYAPMMNKDTGRINWAMDNKEIHNLIRGVTPWPGAITHYNDKMIKIHACKKEIQNIKKAKPGEIVDISKSGIKVACGNGVLVITELQEVGGKKMDAASYLNGHNVSIGDNFI